ncbi:MAG: hypothetical protein ACREBU_04360, partial [Nitrososphaera sp.]
MSRINNKPRRSMGIGSNFKPNEMKIYWLFKPHCSEAIRIKVYQQVRRAKRNDPRSTYPIGQD